MMVDREVRFEDPDFDPDAHLASIVSLASKPPAESSPFAFAASMCDAFEVARDRLGSHAAAAARRAADLAAVASDENDVFLSRVGDVATDAVTLEATLDALHERVDRVAVVTRDAGEALRRAESRRVAADDAVRLARHLVGFDRCRNRERLRFAVDPVFFDEARAAEAAPLARRLLELATDAREAVVGSVAGGARDKNASSDGDGRWTRGSRDAFLATACSNLEWYCDGLEKQLLSAFEDADQNGDDGAATDAAAALEMFGRGSSLARRFVATRPMFTRVEAPTEAPDGDRFVTVAGERDARDAAARAVTSLRGFFESIKNDVVAETRRARALFPEGPAFENAVAALTHRVVEQSVGAAMDAALGAAPPPSPYFLANDAENPGARSQEAAFLHAGARSAPATPLKPGGAARHRRAASVSVATMSRLGGAAAGDGNDEDNAARRADVSSRSQTSDDGPLRQRLSDARHGELWDDEMSKDPSGEASDVKRRVVGDAHRAFALGAYLAALAEAHTLAQRLASDLRADTGGVVRVENALDALFAARRVGYDKMETLCLCGLAAARVETAATDADIQEEETTERKRETPLADSPDAAEARLAARERAVLLDITRWFDAAAKRVDAVFAPPLTSRADEASDRERPDAEDVDEEEKKRISSRAIAAATSLASAAAAEHRIAEAAFEEMTRVVVTTTTRAAALCALRARRLPSAATEEATRRSAPAAADACLGAARAAADAAARAASAAQAVTQSRAAAAATRTASASRAMRGGGDVAASAAAAARATADAAARATAAAEAAFASRAAAAASRCVHAALDVFFGVVVAELETTVSGERCREMYAFDPASEANAAADAEAFFPGQFVSSGCAPALAHLRRAAETLDGIASAGGGPLGASGAATHAAVMRELSSRALAAVTRHFFALDRFVYSAAGALQLKRDLGEFETWSLSLAEPTASFGEKRTTSEDAEVGFVAREDAALRDAIKKQWREALEACDVLLVPPDALPSLLKQSVPEDRGSAVPGGYLTAQASLAPRSVVLLREDFHPSMLKSLPPTEKLAEEDTSGATRHARAGSLSSAFFASFRTQSPPRMR